jgi:hypothetical protein
MTGSIDGEGERVQVSWGEALTRLRVIPDYDPGGDEGPGPCVHTMLDGGVALLGAHWRLSQVEEAVQKWGCEESGPNATRAGHGLVILRDSGPVFLETKRVAAEESS